MNTKSQIKKDPSILVAALKTLTLYLTAFGDANDAEDHGYGVDAERIRQGAREGIHSLLLQHPELLSLFPNLEHDLTTQFLHNFGWSEVRSALSTKLQEMETADASPRNPASCAICSQINEVESAGQKYGWPENDTFLPPASASLVEVRELTPVDSRTLHLWQCPCCGTCYLYKTDYEYLVNGTEDSQSLIRLTPEQAAFYLEN